jgi:hypothetical protein
MAAMGRPSKYSEEMHAKSDAYIKLCLSNKRIPYIEELALELGVNDDTLVEWGKDHDEFSATIKRLKMVQRLCFKRDALERKIHPTMAIFLLKVNHGLDEKNAEPPEPIKVVVSYV